MADDNQTPTTPSLEELLRAPQEPISPISEEQLQELQPEQLAIPTEGIPQDGIVPPVTVNVPLDPTLTQPLISPEETPIPVPDPLPTDESLLLEAANLRQQAEEDTPITETAEDIITQNEQMRQKSQQITDMLDVKDQADDIKEEQKTIMAKVAADQQIQTEEAEKTQANADQIAKEITREREELKNLQMSDIIKNPVNERGILATIGVVLGGILGGVSQGLLGRGPNPFMASFEARMNRDFEAQKLAKKEVLARKQRIYDLIQLRLDTGSRQTDDELKKTRINKMKFEVQAKQQELGLEQIKEQRRIQIANKTGRLSPQDEAIWKSSLNKDELNSLVRSPNGRLMIADNKDAADKLRAFQADVVPAIEGIKRIQAQIEQGSKFSPSDRARVATEVKAIVGQLRLPFTGPGAMTEKEYDRLLDTIGNPIKLFAIESLEKIKLNTVLHKLSSDLNRKYRLAGAPIEKDNILITEDRINTIMKRGKVSRSQAETILRNVEAKRGSVGNTKQEAINRNVESNTGIKGFR